MFFYRRNFCLNLFRLKQPSRLLLSTFVSSFGDGLHTLVIGKLLYEKTNEISSFGLIIILNYFFGIICQWFFGPLVDKFSRKKLLVFSDLFRLFFSMVLVGSVYFDQEVIWIIVTSVFIKIGTHLYRSSFFSVIPEVVHKKDIAHFNSNNVALIQSGQLLGMASLGFLYSFGYTTILLLDSMTFLISSLLFISLSVPFKSLAKKSSALSDWLEIKKIVSIDKSIFIHVMLSASIFLIYQMITISIVPFVELYFDDDKFWLSALPSLFSLGCISATVFIRMIFKKVQILPWMILYPISFMSIYLFKESKVLVSLLYYLLGLFSTVASVHLQTLLMKRVENTYHGRIASFRLFAISVLISCLVPFVSLGFDTSMLHGFLYSTSILVFFSLVTVLSKLIYKNRLFGESCPLPVECI